MADPTDGTALLADDELDKREIARQLGDQYRQAKERLESLESAADALAALARMEEAREEWEKKPEDRGASIVWAKRTGRLISQLGALLPKTGVTFVDEYFSGLFESVPRYVGQVTAELDAYIRRIDVAETAKGGEVRFKMEDGPEAVCSDGRADEHAVEFIKGMNITDPAKMQLFRSTCHGGLGTALRNHGYLK